MTAGKTTTANGKPIFTRLTVSLKGMIKGLLSDIGGRGSGLEKLETVPKWITGNFGGRGGLNISHNSNGIMAQTHVSNTKRWPCLFLLSVFLNFKFYALEWYA